MYYKRFRKRCHWKSSYCGSDRGAACVWWCLWRGFFFCDRKFNYLFVTLDHISIRERSTMGKHICDNQHYEHTEKSFLWNLSSHSSANRKLRTWLADHKAINAGECKISSCKASRIMILWNSNPNSSSWKNPTIAFDKLALLPTLKIFSKVWQFFTLMTIHI